MKRIKTLVEYMAYYAEKQPEIYFAVDSKGCSSTYGEAWNKIRCVARYLKAFQGVSKGERILVRCNQSVGYLFLYLACNLIGAIFVPVEINASGERIREIATETNCKLYVDDCRVDLSCTSILYKELFERHEMLTGLEFPDASDISEILYTTGTTGKSKGIVMTHGANIALAENVKYGVSMREHNTEMIPLVMSHSHALRTFYANLLNGGTVVITDGVMNVKDILRLMDVYRVSALDLSPSAAQILVKLSKGAFWEHARKLDYIEIGTAVLPEKLKNLLVLNLPGVRLYNFYGATESGRTCALDFSIYTGKQKCIGKPSKNAEIIFMDDNRNPIKATPENPGMLASRGLMNMVCYWKNPELTNQVLVNGYICTNDLGYFDEDGNVYVIGRKDDVINYNGIKISPSEIEDIVITYPGVMEAACIGKKDVVAGQIPKLFVVPKDLNSFDMNEFQTFLMNRIDRMKIPKIVELIDVLPRTFNGKLDRKALEVYDDK